MLKHMLFVILILKLIHKFIKMTYFPLAKFQITSYYVQSRALTSL